MLSNNILTLSQPNRFFAKFSPSLLSKQDNQWKVSCLSDPGLFAGIGFAPNHLDNSHEHEFATIEDRGLGRLRRLE